MARAPRPRTLAAGFGAFFVVIALASWGFAGNLLTPWFASDLSRWIYTSYMLVAAIFLVGLGGMGLSIRKSFGRQLRDLDRNIGMAGNDVPMETLPPPLPESAGRDHVDRDIDELLESLTEIEVTTSEEAAVMEQEAESAGLASSDSTAAAQRERLARRQKYLGRYLLGPGLVAGIILGFSGIMMPGVDGFAQTNFRLNTALILGISYSWIAVGAYVAATIYALVSAKDERRRK